MRERFRAGRRRAATTTRVPELVGLPVADAHNTALDGGVLAVDAHAGQPRAKTGIVSRQRPRAGQQVALGTPVHIWVTDPDDPGDNRDNGGGGGGGPSDRSPRGPRPLLTGHK